MGDTPVSKGVPAGGQYLEDGITLKDRQHLTLQLDENGNLKVLWLTTDEAGNVVSVSTEAVGGLTAQITKDPQAAKHLARIVDLLEAQKNFNINQKKSGIKGSSELFKGANVPAYDLYGRKLTAASPRELVISGTANLPAGGTAETTVLAAVAGVFQDVTFISIANRGTGVNVISIRDTTAGTVRLKVVLGVSETVIVPLPVPLAQTTANTNWTAQAIADPVSNGVDVMMIAIKNY